MEDIKAFLGLPKEEYGIPGYQVVKTSHILNKGTKISPLKSPNMPKLKKDPYPDPSKYSPTLEKSQATYWKSSIGKFTTTKKVSYLEEEISRSKSNPGPGAYNKSTVLQSRSPLGKFDKGERLNFMTNAESYAEETPSCCDYKVNEFRKIRSVKWIKPEKPKKVVKDKVGPGKYAQGIEKAINLTTINPPRYSFGKSKTEKMLINKTFTPGVGSYKLADKAFFNSMVKKVRAAMILPYKLKGFADFAIQSNRDVPGPGTYNIVPDIK